MRYLSLLLIRCCNPSSFNLFNNELNLHICLIIAFASNSIILFINGCRAYPIQIAITKTIDSSISVMITLFELHHININVIITAFVLLLLVFIYQLNIVYPLRPAIIRFVFN